MRAVDGISLEINAGEFLVLLGPSGCGKTTLLRLVAGLEEPERGRIVIGGSVVYDSQTNVDVPPENRPTNMVFQSYALWPHMSAFENVAYPLRSRGDGKREVQQRVDAVLKTVGVYQVRDQMPSQMSGGQQQRVALARAIAPGETTILFDEPLSNVDAKVRDRLRIEILKMQRELGFTAVYVTHDQEEAMTMGTRIVVLEEGRIAQVGTPREVYEQPVSRYVANFVGTADELEGHVVGEDDAGVTVATRAGMLHAHPQERLSEGAPCVVVSRPQNWRLNEREESARNRLSGFIDAVLFLGGSRFEYIARVGEDLIRVWRHGGSELAVGSAVTLTIDTEHLLLYRDSAG